MATSSNYTVDRDTLIRMSFEDIGMAVEGEPLEPESITVAARQLNLFLKYLTTKGLRMWKRERQSITLVASQSSYTLGQKYAGTTTSTGAANTLVDSSADFVSKVAVGDTVNNTTDSTSSTISSIDSTTQLTLADDIFTSGENYEITTGDESIPRPERILDCNRKDTDGNETTVTPLSLQEYETLPNKSDTGTPVQYFYDPTLTNGKMFLWLTPDATAATDFTIEIVAAIQVNDMDSSTDSFDFPSYWLEPIQMGLAYRLAKKYGSARLGELQIMKNDAEEAIDEATYYDQDFTSIYIQPDLTRA